MATKLMTSDESTAAEALQSGSRAGAKRRALSMRLAQHHASEQLVARGGRRFARGAAVVKDEDAIGDGAQLVEVERDEQHGGALGARVAEGVVDAGRGAQGEAARRLDRDDQARRGGAGHPPPGAETPQV